MIMKKNVGLFVAMVFGLFMMSVVSATAASANHQVATAPACVQCYAPVTAWNVPATSAAVAPATVCSTCIPTSTSVQTPVSTTCPTPAVTPGTVIGSIVDLPFAVGRCLLGGCS